jgi:putative heme-binding domain-containing protein
MNAIDCLSARRLGSRPAPARFRSTGVWVAAVLCGMIGLQAAPAAEPKLRLEPGDRIAIIGNTLADRMQHSGWLETFTHAVHPELDLVFRNLGYSADTLKERPREENFGSPDQWLEKCRASVVLCFFGYNEALRGPAGLEDFKKDLADTIQGMRAKKYDGKGPPRLVLFSPIAHENLKSPHLPDGSANNANLALYTSAMKEVCGGLGVPFVDLFAPTKAIYEKAEKPLTINGIHLHEQGEKAVAELIAADLFAGAKPGQDEAFLEKLRQAVVDRNEFWFSRYRVVDGYNVFGGRSKLAWHGQSNADVMSREMEIFDVKTANRDARVIAVAKGGDLVVKDDNLPEQLVVKTSKPGPLEGEKHPYLGGEEAIGKMQIAEGMQVNLFASEEKFPDLVNPVQMAVDPDGRLFVAVWPSYPHWNPTEPRRDKIICLPDDNGDGVADRSITFADGLDSVTGFEFWGGGMIVAALPELWFLKDTNNDGKADVKVRLLQGLCSADTHHSANSMLLGPDGWIYWSRGIFNVSAHETPTRTFRGTANMSGVYRFNPRTFEVEFHFPIGVNPHGDVFDQWGYQFANDGTTGVGSYVDIGKGEGNKPWFQKRVRPVPATGILASSHFHEKNQGNFLVCNAIGVLGVLQHEVNYDGADITAREIEPILISSDPNFRPSDMEIGSDGALYVSDWCNAIIGHMQHNMRDPNRDHAHGRIYRVTAKGRPIVRGPRFKGRPIDEICQNAFFFGKDEATRYRARIELSGRPTAEVVAQVGGWTTTLDATKPETAQALLEAVWVFEEHRVPNADLLKRTFGVAERRVRAAAIRTLGHWGPKVSGWEQLLLAAATDASALVRAEAVKAAVSFPGPTAAEAIFEAATRPLDPALEKAIAYARGKIPVDTVIAEAIAAGKPLSRAARAYAVANAPIDALLKLEPAEDVWQAILDRRDAPVEMLRKALDGLAAIRKAKPPEVLMQAVTERDAAGRDKQLEGLAKLVASLSKEDLQSIRGGLESLAASGKVPRARQLGYAGWIAAEGSGDAAFLAASKGKESLRDVLAAVPLVADAGLRSGLYAAVRPLLFDLPPGLGQEPAGAGETLHDLAIRAAVEIPGHDAEKFRDLCQVVKSGRSVPAAVAAVSRIPEPQWNAADLPELAANVVAYLTTLPPASRNAPAGAEATKLVRAVAAKLPADAGKAVLDRLGNLDVRVIAIGTVFERMIFDKETLAVQAGKPVEFRFSNADAMPHNFVIVRPGALEEVGLAAEATARDADAKDRQYVPKSDKILLASRLLESGQTQSLSFEAPKEPGIYPYVCTYPGHWRRMYGALHVVADLRGYEANPAGYLAAQSLALKDPLLASLGRNTDWTYDGLIAAVKPLPSGRSFEVGKKVFAVASCVACHKLGGEGREFGPDLTKIEPAKQTVEHLLKSICEPSSEIAEKFQSQVFVLDSGKVVTGMVVEETPTACKVMVDPLARCEPVVVATAEIDDRSKSPVSLMPKGLLNRLTQEEILDLVAYLVAKGEKTHPVYATKP